MVKQTVILLLRAAGVALSAFLKTIHDATAKPDPRASPAFFHAFSAKAHVNALCARCGSRIHARDDSWVRPDAAGPSPMHYAYICNDCRAAVVDAVSGPS